jgi:hypothetical protein
MMTIYPVNTLEEMATIPIDAIPRFLAELPSILDMHRNMQSMTGDLNTICGDDGVIKSYGFEWIDDGLLNSTVHIVIHNKEG